VLYGNPSTDTFSQDFCFTRLDARRITSFEIEWLASNKHNLKNSWSQRWSQVNVIANECGLRSMWISNKCGLKLMQSQIDMVSIEKVSNKSGLRKRVSHEWGPKWIRSHMNMVSVGAVFLLSPMESIHHLCWASVWSITGPGSSSKWTNAVWARISLSVIKGDCLSMCHLQF